MNFSKVQQLCALHPGGGAQGDVFEATWCDATRRAGYSTNNQSGGDQELQEEIKGDTAADHGAKINPNVAAAGNHPRDNALYEHSEVDDSAAAPAAAVTSVAVKVFRDSGKLASYLRRIYNINFSSPSSSSSSTRVSAFPPPPLHEALRAYIRDHHHHKIPPGEEEEEAEDIEASSVNYDANNPEVYAARELLAMYLVGYLCQQISMGRQTGSSSVEQ